VSSESAWKNPPGVYGLRSKPDLLASGDDVRIVDAASGSGTGFASGTSFAAPMVAGTVGLMNSANRESRGYSASISSLPVEIVRAVLLATALNNVDRVVTPSQVGGFPFVHIGDLDGAGGMDSQAALDVVSKNQYYLDSYPAVCPQPQSRQPLAFARFQLKYGQRARAAIAFSSLPTALGTPTADLAVMVAQIDPVTGAILRVRAWSGSHEDTGQMVEFAAEQAGTYQLYVLTSHCSQPPQYVGYAWWVGP